MRDERLIPTIRKRIESRDYEAVFAHGGCFHFALRLHERFGYTIRGIRAAPDGKTFSHVWGQKPGDSKGVDIRGVYPEELLVRLANGGKLAMIYDVSIDGIRDIIRAQEYPSALEEELFKLADWVIDTHERFLMAKPSDPNLYAQFLMDIEKRSDGSAAV
jgi:hypothetical protein